MKRIFTILMLGFWATSNAQVNNLQLTQLLKKAGFNNLKPEEISINSSNTDKKTGITHIYFKQVVNGVEVFNSQSSIHIDKNGNLFKQNIAIKSTNLVVNNKKIDANAAFGIALNTASIVKKSLNKINLTDNISFKIEDKVLSSEPILGKPIFYEKNGTITTAWQVDVLNDESGDWYNIIIDANSGLIIEKNNYTTKCSAENITSSKLNKPYFFEFDDNESVGKAANNGTYKVFPIPMESPARGDRQLISNSNDLMASPYGWHDTNAVEGPEFLITRGNNVWAKEDTLANNSTTNAYSPNGGTDLIFDFPYGLDAGPRPNLNAAITNLFFWNNTIHDVFYNYGFDEESGNFQSKNYTNKGLGKDFVYAEAQDGSGTDNANFATPVDGLNPRMQMYLWGGSATPAFANILQVNEPSTLAKKYGAVIASFGPRLSLEPITANLVMVNDGGSSSGGNLGCNTLINADSVSGKIALITRGTCTYQTKILNAQAAGAIAVVIVNTSNTATAITGSGTGVNIPVVMVSSTNGNLFKTTLANSSINLSMFDSTVPSAASRTYDSDFDNGVITHEYGHGISTRLTGGPANSSCLNNEEQAGEGWSDFFGLVLTSKPYETSISGRGIGTHLIAQDTNGVGIRPYRYSRSMITNPVNYNSIKTLSVPHGVGFVWCSALYDIYLDMIDKYGFDENMYTGKGGNNKALELVMMGLKLQPCQPGFLDARDAIILADSLLNGGANKSLLWKAFARRGMGFDAKQGLTTSRSDGTAGFKLPAELTVSTNEILNANSIEIYPNPSKGNFIVNASFDLTNSTYSLIDISGKKVQFTSKAVSDSKMEIELSNINSGFYFLSISGNNGSVTKKIVIE
ncbi:MAG: M36 family metallopeptidase [Candidatus Methylacidiphilales bacterium]